MAPWRKRVTIAQSSRAIGRIEADSAGICLAGACAVHCLVMPVATGLLPVVGLTLGRPAVEWTLLLLSVCTSAAVLVRGCARSHRRWGALLPFVAGAGVLCGGRLLDESHPAFATAAVVVGAAAIIASHVLNIRWCRRAGVVHCADVASSARSALSASSIPPAAIGTCNPD